MFWKFPGEVRGSGGNFPGNTPRIITRPAVRGCLGLRSPRWVHSIQSLKEPSHYTTDVYSSERLKHIPWRFATPSVHCIMTAVSKTIRNKMQSETADFDAGAATWRTRRNVRVVFDSFLAHSLHYVKTCRHQKRKYITYYTAVRGRPSHGYR